MNRFNFILVLIILLFLASLSLAGIPKMINYQGMLTDNSGTPLTDTVNMVFKIYDNSSGGNLKWQETQNNVPVINGLFNVILGSLTPIDTLSFSQQYWLEVGVGAETMPRIGFTSVGYAYRALVADSALVVTPGSGSNWYVSNSVLYTNNLWGIARGGADNVLSGYEPYTQVNLGVSCTTSIWGENGYPVGATIGGGYGNRTGDSYATIGGGENNRTTYDADYATVAGGQMNNATYTFAAVGGGHGNKASGYSATVAGGEANVSSGDWATVTGGRENTAQGRFSFAAGRMARANHGGSFVWADSTDGYFTSSGPNQFLIRASGGVGIGTTNPGQQLDVDLGNIVVQGAGSFDSNGEEGIVFLGSVHHFIKGVYGFGVKIGAYAAGDVVSVREISGNVGIGTTDPGYRLDVAGQAHATSFPTSSDARLKKNVTQLSSVLEKLERIRGVSFDWNEKYESMGRSTGHREIGVIAQEVEAVFPELVTTWGKEEYRAVDYGRLAGVLIEAIKELKAENEGLKKRIEVLEAK